MQNRIPVLIVGAGPTGLSMAIELLQFKIPFRIIDKNIKPVSTSNALVLQTRTLEMWDDLDLLNSAFERGIKLTGLNFNTDDKLLGELNTDRLDTLHPYLLGLPQCESERLMLEYLLKNKIVIERETTLVDLHENQEYMDVTLKNKVGQQEVIQVDWLIACDGIHSTVRELIQLPFEGKELPQHFVMGDMKLKSSLSQHRLHAFFSKHGVAMIFPFSKEYSRIIFEVSNDPHLSKEKKPTEQQLKQLLSERVSPPLKIEECIWTSGFSIHEKIIPQYRHNHIFFAGDAAHIHSPAGGQGMNTGMQDAYNLGWKLASVIKGNLVPDILNTYHSERRPVAKGVLKRSTLLTRFGTENRPFLLLIRNLIVKLILKSRLGPKFMATISQLDIQYQNSSLSKECIKSAPGPRAGDRVLDCWLDKTQTNRLLNYIQGPRPTVLFFTGILRNSRLSQLSEMLDKIYLKYGLCFNYVLATVEKSTLNSNAKILEDFDQLLHRKYQVTAPGLYFLRPDKYIGFRGRFNDFEVLLNYLERNFIT